MAYSLAFRLTLPNLIGKLKATELWPVSILLTMLLKKVIIYFCENS